MAIPPVPSDVRAYLRFCAVCAILVALSAALADTWRAPDVPQISAAR